MNRCKLIVLGTFLQIVVLSQHSVTPFEFSSGRESATLKECLAFYDSLHAAYPEFTRIYVPNLNASDLKYHDAGQIRLFVLSNFAVKKEKVKIFINNGIHPGEPDGIDASMLLCEAFLLSGKLRKMLDEVELYVVPIYNTGGAQRRGCCSRANQDGPVEYGFRGTDLNLDLNRDFIKCDALETEVLESFFHKVMPHIFIDTHVSDGADYKYTMTLISSQHNRYQNSAMENFQQHVLLPTLYKKMKEEGEEMCPYVEFDKEIPDSGIDGFFDTPRFSSGYASLFNCFSFMAETHMLKPFNKRVGATYTLLVQLVTFASEQKEAIIKTVNDAWMLSAQQRSLALQWKPDSTKTDSIFFKGYTARYITSAVTGQKQLTYDENQPYSRYIPYHDAYTPVKSVSIPSAYLIPYEWFVKLKLNRYTLNYSMIHDSAVDVQYYMIKSYDTGKRAYEGHFTHSNIVVSPLQEKKVLPGNWVIIPLADNLRYRRMLTEMLEPESPDGFFAWGMMDAILQQKEGFSDYVWDARALEILNSDNALKKMFEERKRNDEKFANDANAQLQFIYQHSKYFEGTFMRYPVYRVE